MENNYGRSKIVNTFFLLIIFMIFLAVFFGVINRINNKSEDIKSIDSDDVQLIFYKMSGDGISEVTNDEQEALDAELIIIGSEGKWGIIDSGHRYEQEITDENGNKYNTNIYLKDEDRNLKSSGLSSQIPGLNGRDAAAFMHEQLGIDHLDFVIATHSHSDHIGGIPDIADYRYISDGKEHYLVDGSTCYFYKQYAHIDEYQDDLGDIISDESFHNQAFYWQAYESMRERGAKLIEVSAGGTVNSNKESGIWLFDEKPLWYLSEKGNESADFELRTGQYNDPAYDSISFSFGNCKIYLYNIYRHTDINNDNSNSLVAVIDAFEKRVYLGADIDNANKIEKKLSEVIYERFGTMDILKLSHHGFNGSNSQETMDTLKPKYLVCMRYLGENKSEKDSIAPLLYHCLNVGKYTELAYESSLTERGLVSVIGDDNIKFYDLSVGQNGEAILKDGSESVNKCDFNNGWYRWDRDYDLEKTPDWYFFYKGRPAVGWNRISDEEIIDFNSRIGKIYHLDANGRMDTGWKEIDGSRYYFSDGHIEEYDTGEMVTGKQVINGKGYIFSDEGILKYTVGNNRGSADLSVISSVNGWEYINGFWYLHINGKVQNGWKSVSGKWYYFDSTGEMLTGWQFISGRWYYFKLSGEMQTGWQKIKGKDYYFKSSGEMASNEWVGGYWWLDSDGEWTYQYRGSWKQAGGRWWFGDESGWYAKNTTIVINEVEYTFDAAGWMQ